MSLARYPEAVRLVDQGKARPQVEEMVELLRAGLSVQDAGRRLGISKSSAYQRLNDPTDERNKARKRAYYGTCEECGGRTSYRVGGVSRRCRTCEEHRNDAENALIIEMWESGEPGWRIAKKLNLTPEIVHARLDYWRRRKGKAIPKHRLGGDGRAREQRRQHVLKLVAEGLTNRQIAEDIGSTGPASVSMMLVEMRRRGYEVPERNGLGGIGGPLVPAEDFIAAYNRGVPLAAMAEMFGYSRATAVSNRVRALRDAGYDLPRRR